MQLVSALTALSLVNSACGSCQGAQLTAVLNCYKTFVEAYGLAMPTPNTLPNYDILHAVRMSVLVGKGEKAQLEICDYGNALVTCLKPHWRCLDNELYLKLGQPTASKAGLYYSDLLVTQYQCSERAMYLFLVKGSCNCTRRVLQEVGGLKATEVCYAYTGEQCRGINIFLSCIYQIYYPHCGSDGAEFLCLTNRAVSWCDNNPAYDVLQCGLQPPEETQQPSSAALQQNSAAAGYSAALALPLLLQSVYSIV